MKSERQDNEIGSELTKVEKSSPGIVLISNINRCGSKFRERNFGWKTLR